MTADQEEDCIHGVWPPSKCTYCTKTKPMDLGEIEYSFRAKYSGRCEGCGKVRWEPGDEIYRTESGLLVAHCCAEGVL